MFERRVPLLLLASGFCGLLYEVVLGRFLALYVGSSGASHAITLVAFLGGLSAGALVAGRWQASALARLFPGRTAAAAALAAYAGLELFAAAWSAAFPHVADAVFQAYFALTSGRDPSGLATLASKLVVAFALVVPLTFAMGATLPVLAGGLERTVGSRSVAAVSRAYSWNAAGGALGALGTGFDFIARFGLDRTLVLGALVNVLVAAAALALARSLRDAAPERSASSEKIEEYQSLTAAAGRLLVAAGLTGFVTLAAEIAWTRLAGLLLGASVYAFALMLTIVIVAIALGSRASAALVARGRAPDAVFAATQLLAALGALWLVVRLPSMSTELLVLRSYLTPSEAAYPVWLFVAGLYFAAHVLPAALGLGASFPALLASARSAGLGTARATAWMLGVNTLGNLAGALLGAFWLMPALGPGPALLAGAALSVANAALVATRTRRGSLMAIGAFAAMSALTLVVPSPIALHIGLFRYHPGTPENARPAAEELLEGAEFRYERHARDASIAVIAHGDLLTFRTNGKVDGGTGDAAPQVSVGHAGFLVHPGARDVFVVGLGTGQTAAAAVSHPDTRVTVAELVPEMVEAAAHFAPYNQDVLKNERIRLVITDAREALQHARPGSLDLVVSEPSNPWVVGVADLFTLEHFVLTRSRLRPDGVLVQWIQQYELSEETLRSMLCTVHRVFPRIHVLRMGPGDLVLLAGGDSMRFDLAAATAEFSRPEVKAELVSHGGGRVPQSLLGLLALEVAALDGIASFCSGFDAPLEVRRPRLEYDAPRSLFAEMDASPALERLDLRRQPPSPDGSMLARALVAQPLDDVARAELEALFAARKIPHEAPLRQALSATLARDLAALAALPPPAEVPSADALCGLLRASPGFVVLAAPTVFGPAALPARVIEWSHRCGPGMDAAAAR
jgi:predicted membrane-bound spermidine synthase